METIKHDNNSSKINNLTFENYIKLFDTEDSIVILEGKRNVLDNEKYLLTKLGRKVANSTTKMKFRSGNASGSDYYFSLVLHQLINHD